MGSSKVHIRLARSSDRQKWDTYVCKDPNGSPYHLFGWKQAVEEAYGHRGYYLMAEDETGQCVGVLPIICFRLPWGKKSFVSLPYCDYAGPLAEDNMICEKLSQEALELSRESGVKKLELRCANPHHNFEPREEGKAEVISEKVRMLLALPSRSSELWSSFKPKLRSQIRRAQKEKMYFRLGADELLNDFYRIFSINMHDLGSPVHSRKWFQALLAAYREHIKLGIVYLPSGLAVAAGIILTVPRRVHIPWASSLLEHNRLAPNMLLYWELLAWSADNGFEQFDFGRSTIGEGTFKFKEQWGPRVHPLFWYKHPYESQNGRRVKLPFDARELAARIISKMPLAISGLVGSKIRRYISL